MLLEAGAEMPERTILLHDLTADEMDAYSVTVQTIGQPEVVDVVCSYG
jgi:hypothetical protein